MKNHFTQSKPGRVLLHALCWLRHPANLRWHWEGIVRELAREQTCFNTRRRFRL
jgi:hypothetical protein